MIEKWRLRHACPDAVSLWAIATAPESLALAFNAIAQDPRILQRAKRQNAIRMALQAEEFAQSVARTNAATSDTWRAATQFVQRAIDAWRQSLRSYERQSEAVGMSFSPLSARARLGDPWEIARRNFPYVDEETGRLTTRILREFGGAVLARVRKPWDHIIALGVLRHAAQMLRGGGLHRGPEPAGERCIDDVLVVQSYAEANLLSPMLVPYMGPGKPAQQALGLMRDACTLRDAVAEAPGGGAMRAAMWQQAIDLHAFAVVALDHRILLDLPLDETYRLAAAAIRQAAAAQGTDTVQMPLLPAECAFTPEVVALHAKACLPGRGMEKVPWS